MFLANPQILKVGRNVTQDLKRLERESQGSNPAPYTGGVELAKLAKDLGVISDARVASRIFVLPFLVCDWTKPLLCKFLQAGIASTSLLSKLNMLHRMP